MFRAGLGLFRRLIIAASLLFLLICGAEVAVRTYEAFTGDHVCPNTLDVCRDPSKLAIPSWSFYQELKPMSVAKVECRDTNSEVEVRTNSFGLRSAECSIPKPNGVCRIVVLGDETIFAPETADSDHFCTLLQNLLQVQTGSKIEVVNAGVPGHCPLTEYLHFKQRLLSLQPDLVLMHYDWSDAADDRQIRRRMHSDRSGTPTSCPHIKLVASKGIRPHDVWRQQFRLLDWGLSSLSFEWKKQMAQRKASSRDVDSNPYAWLRDENPQQNVAFRQSVRPIADLAQLCQLSKRPFVVMTSPKPWQVSAKCSRGDGVRLAEGVGQDACFSNRAPFDVLAGFTHRARIPFIDGTMVFAPGKDAEANFLRYAPRWSQTGHRRMAEFVANSLLEKMADAIGNPSMPQHEQPLTRRIPRSSTVEWASGQQPNQTENRIFEDR